MTAAERRRRARLGADGEAAERKVRAPVRETPPLPAPEPRVERPAKDREAYERAMLEATAQVYDALQDLDPQRGLIVSRTAGGRIYCRSVRLQRALRTIDEVAPPRGEG